MATGPSRARRSRPAPSAGAPVSCARFADAVRPGCARHRLRRCGGDGRVAKEPCHECHGRGRKAARVKVSVDVPAGIEDGQRIRITGRGHDGEHGGPAGDLYVQIRVREDPRFVRNQDDLVTVVDVAAPLAALGTTVEVPTIDGTVSSRSRPAPSPTRRSPSAARACQRCAAATARRSTGRRQRRDPEASAARAARAAPAARRLADRGQPPHRGGRVRQAPARLRRLIRLAVRVRPRARRAGAGRAARAGARVGWRRPRSPRRSSSTRSTARRASCRRCRTCGPRRRRARRGLAPRRSPTTGQSAGASFIARWSSMTG